MGYIHRMHQCSLVVVGSPIHTLLRCTHTLSILRCTLVQTSRFSSAYPTPQRYTLCLTPVSSVRSNNRAVASSNLYNRPWNESMMKLQPECTVCLSPRVKWLLDSLSQARLSPFSLVQSLPPHAGTYRLMPAGQQRVIGHNSIRLSGDA